MLFRLLIVLCLSWPMAAYAVDEITVSVGSQDFSISHIPAKGSQLVIWAIPAMGSTDRMENTAEALAKQGVEVWMVNLTENLFLPAGANSQRRIPGNYVAGLIEAAHKQTGKRITVMGRSYTAIPVLRGVREWQARQVDKKVDYLNGVILFSPELYATIPSLGLPAEYVPVVSATNVPIVLFQAEKRGNRWQLNSLLEKLQDGGAQVYVKMLKGVTGLYYHGDTSDATKRQLQQAPQNILNAISLLQRTPTPTQALPLPQTTQVETRGMDRGLSPYQGEPNPAAIDLPDTDGTRYRRKDYRGKVTVINFWATWCGPCREEIPALNNLRKKMTDQPFELISVNYAESKDAVADFLDKVEVDYPVLLDKDGKVAADWQVLVFPSTFVIGPDGKIAYGVNGAIHWDAADVVSQLKQLLNTPSAELKIKN